VNMPTHAHGQGYADLNFLIPELLADLHYEKGPYCSLNPSDGGQSSRSSLSVNAVHRSDSDQAQFSAYVIRYRLDLWSTFTTI